MSCPKYKTKHSFPAMFNPPDFIGYYRNISETPLPEMRAVIMCYQKSVVKKLEADGNFTHSQLFASDLFIHKSIPGLCVAANFGVGAPCAASRMEEFIALGAKRFISIGTAGAIHKSVRPGEIMLCDKALRDEGTSYHYLPDTEFSLPSPELTRTFAAAITRRVPEYITAGTWTTDAVYRETKEEVTAFAAKGICTVEMEAAALFAVAEFRRVSIASAFAISDCLVEDWKPKFHVRAVSDSLDLLLESAIETLAS